MAGAIDVNWVCVAVGGAAGASLRYALGLMLGSLSFLWATLLVNVIGSAMIGVVYGLSVQWTLHPRILLLVQTGFLGALTTFSTFSYEAMLLLESSRRVAALAYLTASVALCLLATCLSVWLTRWVLNYWVLN